MPYFSLSDCRWDWILSWVKQNPEAGRYWSEVTRPMRGGAENRNAQVGDLFRLCPRSVASGAEAGLRNPPSLCGHLYSFGGKYQVRPLTSAACTFQRSSERSLSLPPALWVFPAAHSHPAQVQGSAPGSEEGEAAVKFWHSLGE